MHIFRRVTLKFIDHVLQQPVCNVALLLTLYAKQKNNYVIGPFLTDTCGEILITEEGLRKEIKAYQSMYIMDYESKLEECENKFSLVIATKKEITFFLENHKKFRGIYKKYWNYSNAFLNALESCVNEKYEQKRYYVDTRKLNQEIIQFEVVQTGGGKVKSRRPAKGQAIRKHETKI